MTHRHSTHHQGRSHSLVPHPARTWRLWGLDQPVQSSPGECSQTCPFFPSNSQWPSHLRLWCVCPMIDRISTINASLYNYVDVLIPPPPHTPTPSTHPHTHTYQMMMCTTELYVIFLINYYIITDCLCNFLLHCFPVLSSLEYGFKQVTE